MKLLVFHIGPDRYGLPLKAIRRVLPLLELKSMPLAHEAVAGLMNLYGEPVPVIDLARMAGYDASASHFDTRIVVADYHAPDGTVHALGLLTERVQGVQEIDEARLREPGVRAAPFLGQVGSQPGGGMMQLIELEHLLPPALRADLFSAEARP